MTGDCHAGICGSPGVKFPWATRQRTLPSASTASSLHQREHAPALQRHWERLFSLLDRTLASR